MEYNFRYIKKGWNQYEVRKYTEEEVKDIAHFNERCWSSIGHIGRTYRGVVLTREEYERVEQNHLSFLRELCEAFQEPFLVVEGFEPFRSKRVYKKRQVLSISKAMEAARGCLREEFYCRLRGEHVLFHFDYDYFMDVACPLSLSDMRRMAEAYELYVDEYEFGYGLE